MDDPRHFLSKLHSKVVTRERLSLEDGLDLFRSPDVVKIGDLAQSVRRRLHGNTVYYSVNFHLNHTNVCDTRCYFCAFSRDAGDPGAYTLTVDEIETRVREALARWDINEVHIVGGHNPALRLDYYTEMIRRLRQIKKERAGTGEGKNVPLFIKAFSATEINGIAKREGLGIREVLEILKQAGLDSMPGGGAEIFSPEVRRKICPRKMSGEEWIAAHRTAHELGIPTNATMLYGHLENDHDCVEHMLKIRALQDETGGFQAFIPLPYCQPRSKSGPAALSRSVPGETSGYLDLKVLSIARLMLDNVPHVRVHGAATGLKLAQASLSFGVDDIGGTNLDEKIMRESGGANGEKSLSPADLVRYIESAGYTPCLTDSSYAGLQV